MMLVSLDEILRRAGVDQDALVRDALVVAGTEPRAIFIGGSLADGCGNTRSDVDVYLLLDEAKPARAAPGFPVSVLQGRSLQYDLISVPQLDAAIEALEVHDFADVSMTLGTNQLLHRLSRAVVVQGDDVVRRYQARLESINYRGFSSHVKLEQCENALQDAYGAWEGEQYETALYNARLAAHRSLEAVLALRGQTATNEKWVFEKLFQSLGRGSAVTRSFLRLFRSMPETYDREGVRPCFDECMRFIQRLLDVAAVEAITNGGLGTELLDGIDCVGGVRRNERVHVRRQRGKNIVNIEAWPRSEFSDRATLVWAALAIAPDTLRAVEMAATSGLFGEVDHLALAMKLEASWAAARMIQ